MNPNETKIPNNVIMLENSKIVPLYKIIGPSNILPLVKQFSLELYNIWYTIPHWVIQADVGRLLYIYYHGGMYLDCDCIINKKISSSAPVVLFTERIVSVSSLGPRECKHPNNRVRIANYAFMTTVKEHPFLKSVIIECIRRLHLLPSKITHADVLWVCGPDVITSIYHSQNPPDVELLDESYLKHHRCGSWR
jgi:mannosyltransferase OCH1-like enzyme